MQQRGVVHSVALRLLRQAAHAAGGAAGRVRTRRACKQPGRLVRLELACCPAGPAATATEPSPQGEPRLSMHPQPGFLSIKTGAPTHRRVNRWVSRCSSKAGMPQPSSDAFLPRLARLRGRQGERQRGSGGRGGASASTGRGGRLGDAAACVQQPRTAGQKQR